MKKYSLVAILCLLCFNSYSQTENIWKRKPWKDLKYQNRKTITPLNDTIVRAQPTKNVTEMPVLKLDLTMKVVGKAGENDVYIMEPYHMPGIKPAKSFKSPMPVVGFKAD